MTQIYYRSNPADPLVPREGRPVRSKVVRENFQVLQSCKTLWAYDTVHSLDSGEGISSVGTAATVTYANHPFSPGDSVTITGALEPEYNGTFTIATPDANTFTYTMLGDPTSPATTDGEIEVRRTRQVLTLGGPYINALISDQISPILDTTFGASGSAGDVGIALLEADAGGTLSWVFGAFVTPPSVPVAPVPTLGSVPVCQVFVLYDMNKIAGGIAIELAGTAADNTVVVTQEGHGLLTGDYVLISDVVFESGDPIGAYEGNAFHQVIVIDANSYSYSVTVAFTDDSTATALMDNHITDVRPFVGTAGTGIQGATGVAGPAGVQGTTGLGGPQGETGLVGPQGADGVTGPQGETGPSGAASLQVAYDGGNTITQSTAIAITQSTAANSITINKTNTGAGILIAMTNSGTGKDIDADNWDITQAGTISSKGLVVTSVSGYALNIVHTGLTHCISIDHSASGYAIYILNRDGGNSINIDHRDDTNALWINQNNINSAIRIDKTNTGAGGGIDVYNSGSGFGVRVSQVGEANAVYINKSATGSSHVIDITNAGTGYDIDGNVSNWYIDKNGNATFRSVTSSDRYMSELAFDSGWFKQPYQTQLAIIHGLGYEPELVQTLLKSYHNDAGEIITGCHNICDDTIPLAVAEYDSTSFRLNHYDKAHYVSSVSDANIQNHSGELKLRAYHRTPNYDSGWFAVASGITYTKAIAPALASYPQYVQCEFAQNNDGSGWHIIAAASTWHNGATYASGIVSISTAQIQVRIGNLIADLYSYAGAHLTPAAGWCRIKAWVWTPDYDSGWQAISTINRNKIHFHQLNRFPSLINLYFAQNSDGSGYAMPSLISYYQTANNVGTGIIHISEKSLTVRAGGNNVANFIDAAGAVQAPLSGYYRAMAWR